MAVYLDWNATTPPLDAALDAMAEAARAAWANPASVHRHGRAARAAVEDARAEVARLVGLDARDVVFTSGGTEANNLALRALARGGLVTSRLEHPSITRVAEELAREGVGVRWLRVEPSGVVDLDDLERALGEARPSLVALQAVNHETGVVQPLAEAIALTRRAGARIHVDAVQAWGKVEVPAGWDTAAVAAHKIRGPKGIGALAAREGIRLDPLLVGGAQEKGIRPGTVSAPLAAGFGAAARAARDSVPRWAAIAPLRDDLESSLLALAAARGVPARVAGDSMRRAPHVSNIVWPGWAGAELVAALDLEGLSVSSGAACSAGTVEPSPVLLAMMDAASAASGVRCSLGDTTTATDIAKAKTAFAAALRV